MAQQLPLNELGMVVARIQGLLLTEEKATRAVGSLARAAKESVAGTIGAGVSLLDARGRRTSSGYTDRTVELADAAQYENGEGPCLTAWASEAPVLVADLHGDGRWPAWQNAVVHLPIRSVVSVPLMAGKESIGVLKLYAASAGTYDQASAELVQLFASPAGTLISHIQTREAPQKMTETLQASLHSRDLVNRACGVLMERLGVGYEEALQQLILEARGNGSRLQDVSAYVLAGAPDPLN